MQCLASLLNNAHQTSSALLPHLQFFLPMSTFAYKQDNPSRSIFTTKFREMGQHLSKFKAQYICLVYRRKSIPLISQCRGPSTWKVTGRERPSLQTSSNTSQSCPIVEMSPIQSHGRNHLEPIGQSGVCLARSMAFFIWGCWRDVNLTPLLNTEYH